MELAENFNFDVPLELQVDVMSRTKHFTSLSSYKELRDRQIGIMKIMGFKDAERTNS